MTKIGPEYINRILSFSQVYVNFFRLFVLIFIPEYILPKYLCPQSVLGMADAFSNSFFGSVEMWLSTLVLEPEQTSPDLMLIGDIK